VRWKRLRRMLPVPPCILAVGIICAPVFTTITKGDVSEQERRGRWWSVRRRMAAVWTRFTRAKLPAVDFRDEDGRWNISRNEARAATTWRSVKSCARTECAGHRVCGAFTRARLMTAQILTQPYHFDCLPKHPDPIKIRGGGGPGSLK